MMVLDSFASGKLATASFEQQQSLMNPLWVRNRPLYVASCIIVVIFTEILLQYSGLDLLRVALVWAFLLCIQVAVMASIGLWASLWRRRERQTGQAYIEQDICDAIDFSSFCSTKLLLLWSLPLVLVPYFTLVLFWIPSLELPRLQTYALFVLCAILAWLINYFLVKLHVDFAIYLMKKLEAMLKKRDRSINCTAEGKDDAEFV
jgi:hypothetical protein